MDVKKAVGIATTEVLELFQSEKVSNIGLEEVEHDPADAVWRITIGFSRPWDYPPSDPLYALRSGAPSKPSRSYKVVAVRDSDGSVLSIKNREVPG